MVTSLDTWEPWHWISDWRSSSPVNPPLGHLSWQTSQSLRERALPYCLRTDQHVFGIRNISSCLSSTYFWWLLHLPHPIQWCYYFQVWNQRSPFPLSLQSLLWLLLFLSFTATTLIQVSITHQHPLQVAEILLDHFSSTLLSTVRFFQLLSCAPMPHHALS